MNSDAVIDRGLVTPPETAANWITVGAMESLRPGFNITYQLFGFSSVPSREDLVVNNGEGIAAFGSRGPMRDGRIKPDVVAPGTSIFSTRSQNAPENTDFGSSIDTACMLDGGMSMATPFVTGCVTVLRFYSRTR